MSITGKLTQEESRLLSENLRIHNENLRVNNLLKERNINHSKYVSRKQKEIKYLQSKLTIALEIIEKLKKSNSLLDSSLTRYLDAEDMIAKRTCDNETISTIELARQTQKEVNEMMEKLNKETRDE